LLKIIVVVVILEGTIVFVAGIVVVVISEGADVVVSGVVVISEGAVVVVAGVVVVVVISEGAVVVVAVVVAVISEGTVVPAVALLTSSNIYKPFESLSRVQQQRRFDQRTEMSREIMSRRVQASPIASLSV
jgi:hypothetical protein